MAIDPKLVSIKTAAELPSGIPTPEGEFLYYENNELKKAEMSDLYDRLESAYLGIITPSSTIPASGSWYGNILEAGTFNNVTPAITVDAADFDVQNGTANNEVRIIISDGVATKDVRRVKGETGVVNYNTGTLDPLSEDKAETGKTVSEYIGQIADYADIVYKPFTLHAGNISDTGLISSSTSWLHAKTALTDGETITIEGYGNTAYTSPYVRIAFFNSATQNESTFIDKIYADGQSSLEATAPSGTQSAAIFVLAGTGVGSSPSTSPYNETLKIYTGSIFETTIKGEKISGTITTPQIQEIEEETFKNRFFDGIGVPSALLGNNDDKYLDNASLRLYTKKAGSWGDGVFMGGEEDFYYPNDFTFRPLDISRQTNKTYRFKDFTTIREEFVQPHIDSLTPYYVDAVNGSNSNNGLTQGTAFKTLYYAVVTAGARLIYVIGNEGFMDYDSDFKGMTDIASSQPLIIIGVGNVIFAGARKANRYTWTANSGCWSAVVTNPQNVFDFDNLDADGLPNELMLVTSIAECQSTPNSYYYDSGTIYVHPLNNAQPTSKIEICIVGNNRYIASENVPFLYIENCGFATQIPAGCFEAMNNSSTQFNTKIYLSRCFAFKNKHGDLFRLNNLKESWVENCRGIKAKRDAFNYHTTLIASGYEPMKVVEINCFSKDTGKDFPTETSANGSSMHEGGTIMRLNGEYNNGRGGNIADVSPGVLSLNLNVKANGNYRTDGGSFLVQDGKMWLYDCIAMQDLATQFSVSAASGEAYYKDLTKNQQFIGTVTSAD